MKKMRKIIPALAMLLVSAVMMSTASFAWFSTNSTVTASTMTVKATSTANLYIVAGVETDADKITTTSASLTTNNVALMPVTTNASSGTVTFKIPKNWEGGTEPTVSTSGTAVNFTDVGTATATATTDAAKQTPETGTYDLDSYAATAFVTIVRKHTNEGAFTLKPSCTLTLGNGSTDNSELNKALRVGLIINGSFYVKGELINVATGAPVFAFDDIAGLANNTVYNACLVVWYEGTDEDCKANNAVSLTTNTASWTFIAEEPTAG